MIRCDPVIRVNEADIFPFANVQPSISCRGRPLVLLVYDRKSVVPRAILVAYHSTAVSAPVIDENDLIMIECLTEDRVETLTKVMCSIVNWYDD